MDNNKLKTLSDEALLKKAKQLKSAAIINAFLIGFLIGIVVYSVAVNTWGFLTLIPLFLIYKLVNNSTRDKEEIEKLLKERNLKP